MDLSIKRRSAFTGVLLLCALSMSATAYAGRFGALICSSRDGAVRPGATLVNMGEASQLSDGEIAYIYIQANLFEVETAELGIAQGTSDDVKKHGEMVAKDHRGVVKMFEELLHMNYIKPVEPTGSAATVTQHEAIMANLKSKKGADFDKAYLAHEAGNHRAVIDAIKTTLLPAVKSPAIAKHMQDVLPAFEHHLAMTVDAAKRAGVTTTN